MSRLTGSEVANLMQAYSAVHNNNLREEILFEEFLTEEFILEAYQYVADFLVAEGHVPGYETAELFMAEMDEHWIDEILCDYGLYLNEGPFSNFANTVVGGVKRAGSAVAGGVRRAAGAADRGVAAAGSAVRTAGQVATGAAQRAGSAVAGAGRAAAGAAQRAGQTAVGAAQRAGGAVARAATPVAQAVKGTAQRAVAAGQSALGSAGRAVQGAGQAVVGGAQRAGAAVAGAAQGAARRVGQEIEISRRVGAGQPIGGTPAKVAPKAAGGTAATKPAPQQRVMRDGSAAGKPAAAPAARPAAAAPAAAPAAKPAAATPAPAPAAAAPAKRQSLASQAAELRQMRAASQARQGVVNAHYEVEGDLIDETTLSAKAARAGKDIGKPGKQFAKIAKEAGERYGSEERGKKVAGAVLAKMRAKANLANSYEAEGEDIHEIPLVVAAPLAAGALYAAGKGMEAMKKKVDAKIDRARKTSPIGGDRRVPQMNSYQPDNFDFILEYLVAEGHADTNEQAIALMANLTPDQIQGIIENSDEDSARKRYNALGGDANAKRLGVVDSSGRVLSPDEASARKRYNALGGDANAKRLGVVK
jgi:hypothetical protein